MRMQSRASLKCLENIISEVKKKADKLNHPDIVLESDGRLNFVVYHYETDKDIIERIEFRINWLEKELITRKEDKYQKYLELKKEFE